MLPQQKDLIRPGLGQVIDQGKKGVESRKINGSGGGRGKRKRGVDHKARW